MGRVILVFCENGATCLVGTWKGTINVYFLSKILVISTVVGTVVHMS